MPGQPGRLHGVLELVATDLDREPLQFRDRLPFGALQFHQAVQRHEYPHIVPVAMQVAAERRRNVAKAAGLCEGRNLRRQETDTLTPWSTLVCHRHLLRQHDPGGPVWPP